MGAFIKKIVDNLIALIVTTIIAIITLFSDKIVGKIKFELNKADLRISFYEKFAASISSFIVDAENVINYYYNGVTAKTSLHKAVDPYNNSIDDLRKQEYITYANLHKYWGDDDVMRFETIMETAKKIDILIHSLNPGAEAMENGVKKNADPQVIKPTVVKLIPLNKQLEIDVKRFFFNLK